MLTRQLHLTVSSQFEIPFVYTKNNIQEIEEALWLGASVQASVKSKRSNDEVLKITELKDNEIQRIQTTYQDKLTKLLDDLKTVTDEKEHIQNDYLGKMKEAQQSERTHLSKEYDDKIRLLQKDYDILSSKYSALESSRLLLEQNRNKDIQDAVQRTEDIMNKLVSSKQEQLSKLESTYYKLQESIQKQSEELVKLSSILGKRNSNVKTKGSDYEEQFGLKLRKHYGFCQGFHLKETHLGSGHEMDFSMGLEGHIIMWELKNYSNTVPKAEVDKFLRDLKENPQSQIGVMISRSTDIYSKSHSGLLLTEFYEDKMMIYLNRFEEFCGEDESRVFEMLLCLFRIWRNYHHEEKDSFDRTEMIHELEKAVEELSKRRTEWKRHKAHLDEISRWTQDLLEESESRFDRLLKKALNKNDMIYQNTIESILLPEDVFRESKEEKDIQWSKSIMTMCEIGGQIEVRELVDLLSVHHKLSKDTIRSKVMSVMKDSCIFKKGVSKWIKGISKKVPKCEIQFS